ncbi:MAG TPA: hypothetical protein VMR25_10950 [Planctomycetaceae bacterium]|jgi:hypothetical protein|nr:hypothetical protein [Planctomycetaceae bacterium]
MMLVQAKSSNQTASIYDEALREAQRHKWIESQKHGRDLGDQAIRDWYRKHWRTYCRHRRLEHLRGRRRWAEFDDEPSGQIDAMITADDMLVDRVLDRVYAGYENLDIINWAIDWGLPTNRVVEILARLDVNRARFEPFVR